MVLTPVIPECIIKGMKTAISLPDEMFKEIEEVTKECECSRSQVFVMAVREFLERRKSKKLLEALNKAYEGAETPEETTARQRSKAYHANKVRTEPY
jgi:metal-responsive CopG/Arc/MetJ family transcriptional regulator